MSVLAIRAGLAKSVYYRAHLCPPCSKVTPHMLSLKLMGNLAASQDAVPDWARENTNWKPLPPALSWIWVCWRRAYLRKCRLGRSVVSRSPRSGVFENKCCVPAIWLMGVSFVFPHMRKLTRRLHRICYGNINKRGGVLSGN